MMPQIFVGGGQAYHGPTAERDAAVVKEVAKSLAFAVGDRIEIVTGGMPGIPDDFAAAWWAAGGRRVLCVVSSEHEGAYHARNLPYAWVVAGASQEARRLAVTKLPGLCAAFFVQGGKYSTHEMKLLQEAGVIIVAHHGSGGAAGGEQPYEGWSYTPTLQRDSMESIDSRDPDTPPKVISAALSRCLLNAALARLHMALGV